MLNWIPVTENIFLKSGMFVRWTPVEWKIEPNSNEYKRVLYPEEVGIIGDFEEQWAEHSKGMQCFQVYNADELEQGTFYEITHYLECPILQDMTEEQLEKIVELLSGI